ncbi:hypothetical protein DFR29_10299 [Tahibacter aquaticus]|uniref:Uncharacterized protein n=1 Tax=Tahibacter aquaticus TaxID=520092 RepID=A0A4R6Z6P6_9GAMM|nr:hypothetical protein [Tahibacter aquaticus]TDR47440.1 hypothetical protein DFR29_10299 [Tahibacter aquaticus]
MVKQCLFTTLAWAMAATAQAQSWSSFINASPVFRSTLAPEHGLALDDAGAVFVQGMDWREVSGTEFSHLYALNDQGGHAYMWGLVGRSGWTDSSFVSRGFHAFRGERVAWYETGPAAQPFDLIWAFPQGSHYGTELRLQRLGGDEVIDVAGDGSGGVLVVRRRGEFGPSGPLPHYTLARYAGGSNWPQWEQPIGHCAPGELELTRERIDFALDAHNPSASAVHLLGRCDTGFGNPDLHFVQRFDLDGTSSGYWDFNSGVSQADIVAWHRLGGGAWLLEQAVGVAGGERQLLVADAQHGVQPLPWWSGAPLQVDAVERGALVSAPPWPGSPDQIVASVRRGDGLPSPPAQLTDLRFHPGLAQISAQDAQWSSDAFGNRVLVYRNLAPADDSITIAAYGQDTALLSQRLIDRVPADARAQLRPAGASGDIVLAIDRQHEDGREGIQLLRFSAANP